MTGPAETKTALVRISEGERETLGFAVDYGGGDSLRPLMVVYAVLRQKGQRQALQPEADAAGVGEAAFRLDSEGAPEEILVIVDRPHR